MTFCNMFYLFVISYFIILDIHCSERITVKASTVTNSDKKKNIGLFQLINQETLIRFELDKKVRKINSKVDTIKFHNKLASKQFNQEISSINATLSGLRKNQDETNEAVNIVKINQTSTDSEIGLLKKDIKSLKQKQKIDQKLASDQFNQEIQSINTTLSGLMKNQDETNEEVNIVKTNQYSTDSLLREEIKSLKQKQKVDIKNANDQYNQGMLYINATLLGLRKNQDETNEAVNIVKINQTSTDSEIGLLKEDIKSLKQKQKIDQNLASDQFNQEILSINATLSGLRKTQDETNEAFKTDQTSTDSEIGLLREELKSMKQKHVNLEYNQQKLITDLVKDKIENNLLKKEIESLKAIQKELILNVTGTLKDQVNIPISNIRTSLLRSQQEQAKLSSAQTKIQHKQAQISSAQANLQQKQTTLSSELSAFQSNYTNMIQYQVNIPISNIRTSLLRSQQEQAKLSSEQTKMQHKQAQISSAQANLQQKQTTLSSELSVLQNNYTNMIQSRKSQVSFTAGLSSEKRSLSPKETIIYQYVISNIGKGYNAKTGIFTAPQEGTYVFYFSTYPLYAGRPLYLDMVRNGNTVTRGYTHDKDASDAVSGLAVIHLTAADKVWIRCYSGCNAGIYTFGYTYTSTFSGFML